MPSLAHSAHQAGMALDICITLIISKIFKKIHKLTLPFTIAQSYPPVSGICPNTKTCYFCPNFFYE